MSAAYAGYRVTTGVIVRTVTLREHGGFSTDTTTSEDHDLFLRLGEAAGFVFVESPYLYAYRTNVSSLSTDTKALYNGLRLLLGRELRGRYGGKDRRAERAVILGRIIRYKLRRCLESGDRLHGYLVYLQSLPYLLSVDRAAIRELTWFILDNLKSRKQVKVQRLEKSTQF